MRITFLLPRDDLAGGTRVVATYARLLQQRGHQVLVVCNAQPKPSIRDALRLLRHRHWSVLRRRYFPQPGHMALSGVSMYRLERHRPIVACDLPDADVVVATWWETAMWMQKLPESKGKRVHLIQDYETWFDKETNRQVCNALQLPNFKIAISHSLRQNLLDHLGPLDIKVVPNAIDSAHFDAPRRQRQGRPRIGFIYGSSHRKAPDRYSAAISLARHSVPELEVLAFGSESPISNFPLPPDTRFIQHPAQTDIPKLYAQCDAWLFASRIDSFGLPILEAMACRTPVIGVPIGAAPDLLVQGGGVLLSGTTDEEALCQEMADAIVRLCRMPAEQWQAMSDAAYAQSRRYSWQDATTLFEGLLQQAIEA